jgi:hypothetical protein
MTLPLQLMSWNRANWSFADGSNCIDATLGTGRKLTVLHIMGEVILGRCIGALFIVFQGPLIFCHVNLAKIIDTGIHLRRVAGLDKIGNRNRHHQWDEQYGPRNSKVARDQARDGQSLAGQRAI